MNEIIKVIDSREVLGKNFEIYGTFENPLFLAKDVAVWIEHSNHRVMIENIDADEKEVNFSYTVGDNQEKFY